MLKSITKHKLFHTRSISVKCADIKFYIKCKGRNKQISKREGSKQSGKEIISSSCVSVAFAFELSCHISGLIPREDLKENKVNVNW